MLVNDAAELFRLHPVYVALLARSASHRYKTYTIAKVSGGQRLIEHPAREIKLLQHFLTHKIFSRLPVHPAATAYERRSSIARNATTHRANNFLLKVDFQNFFHSIRKRDVVRLLSNAGKTAKAELTPADIEFAVQVVCRFDRLAMGAPSSPIVSNRVMYEFDVYWSAFAQKTATVYTRYADDLYFSTNTPDVLSSLLSHLRAYLSESRSPQLSLNDAKTVFTSRKRRRMITGLLLTPQGNISLGRKRKRHIRSMVHKLRLGQLSPIDAQSLKGMLAYAHSVEPSFIEALKRKFGPDVFLSGLAHGGMPFF
jgi:RNA-directed DNA polymerase